MMSDAKFALDSHVGFAVVSQVPGPRRNPGADWAQSLISTDDIDPSALSEEAQARLQNLPPEIREMITRALEGDIGQETIEDGPASAPLGRPGEEELQEIPTVMDEMERLNKLKTETEMIKPTPDTVKDGDHEDHKHKKHKHGPMHRCKACMDLGYIIVADRAGTRHSIACSKCPNPRTAQTDIPEDAQAFEDQDVFDQLIQRVVDSGQDLNCPACGGTPMLLGPLGNRLMLRCQNCGDDFGVGIPPKMEFIANGGSIGDLFKKDDGSLVIQTKDGQTLPIEPMMAIQHFGPEIAARIGVEPNPLAGTRDVEPPRYESPERQDPLNPSWNPPYHARGAKDNLNRFIRISAYSDECPKCKGTGKYIGGRFTAENPGMCYQCKGTGKTSNSKTAGVKEKNQPMQKCHDCGKTSKITGSKPAPCPHCKGSNVRKAQTEQAMLTGKDYPWVCPQCQAAVDQAAMLIGEDWEDTDDPEAPMMFAGDHKMLCGGRECVNKPPRGQREDQDYPRLPTKFEQMSDDDRARAHLQLMSLAQTNVEEARGIQDAFGPGTSTYEALDPEQMVAGGNDPEMDRIHMLRTVRRQLEYLQHEMDNSGQWTEEGWNPEPEEEKQRYLADILSRLREQLGIEATPDERGRWDVRYIDQQPRLAHTRLAAKPNLLEQLLAEIQAVPENPNMLQGELEQVRRSRGQRWKDDNIQATNLRRFAPPDRDPQDFIDRLRAMLNERPEIVPQTSHRPTVAPDVLMQGASSNSKRFVKMAAKDEKCHECKEDSHGESCSRCNEHTCSRCMPWGQYCSSCYGDMERSEPSDTEASSRSSSRPSRFTKLAFDIDPDMFASQNSRTPSYLSGGQTLPEGVTPMLDSSNPENPGADEFNQENPTESGSKVVHADDDMLILHNPDGKIELYGRSDDYAGFTIRYHGKGYEFVRSLRPEDIQELMGDQGAPIRGTAPGDPEMDQAMDLYRRQQLGQADPYEVDRFDREHPGLREYPRNMELGGAMRGHDRYLRKQDDWARGASSNSRFVRLAGRNPDRGPSQMEAFIAGIPTPNLRAVLEQIDRAMETRPDDAALPIAREKVLHVLEQRPVDAKLASMTVDAGSTTRLLRNILQSIGLAENPAQRRLQQVARELQGPVAKAPARERSVLDMLNDRLNSEPRIDPNSTQHLPSRVDTMMTAPETRRFNPKGWDPEVDELPGEIQLRTRPSTAAELDRRGRFAEADQVEDMIRGANLAGEALKEGGEHLLKPANKMLENLFLGSAGAAMTAPVAVGLLGAHRTRKQAEQMGIPSKDIGQVIDWLGRIDPQKVEAYKRLHGGAPINRTPFGTRPSDRKLAPLPREYGFMPQRPSRAPFDERPSYEPTGNI